MKRISSRFSMPNGMPVRFALCAAGAGGLISPPTTPMIRSTPALMPCANFPFAKRRRDVLGDDAPRGDVGKHALEPVADLDPHLPVVLRDQEQRAVVLALAPDLPLLGNADRICLDRFRLRRRHDQHGELIRRLRFQSASFDSSAEASVADRVFVRSVTRAESGGIGSSPSVPVSHVCAKRRARCRRGARRRATPRRASR
jgi:hypothetical protein